MFKVQESLDLETWETVAKPKTLDDCFAELKTYQDFYKVEIDQTYFAWRVRTKDLVFHYRIINERGLTLFRPLSLNPSLTSNRNLPLVTRSKKAKGEKDFSSSPQPRSK